MTKPKFCFHPQTLTSAGRECAVQTSSVKTRVAATPALTSVLLAWPKESTGHASVSACHYLFANPDLKRFAQMCNVLHRHRWVSRRHAPMQIQPDLWEHQGELSLHLPQGLPLSGCGSALHWYVKLSSPGCSAAAFCPYASHFLSIRITLLRFIINTHSLLACINALLWVLDEWSNSVDWTSVHKFHIQLRKGNSRQVGLLSQQDQHFCSVSLLHSVTFFL